MARFLGIAWNALLTAVVVTLLAGLFVAAMPPVYQATAIVRGSDDEMLQLQSASLLAEVTRTTSVDLTELRGWFEQLTEGEGGLDKITLLQQKLDIARGEKADWINITVEAQDAKSAAQLADGIAREYSRQRMRKTLSAEDRMQASRTADIAGTQLLGHLEQDPRLLDYPSALRALQTQIRQIEQKIEAIDKEITRLGVERSAASRGDTGALTEPGVVRVLQRLKSLEATQAGLAKKYGSAHQKMTAIQAQLAQANRSLADELEGFRKRLDQRITVHEQNRAQFGAEIETLQMQILALQASETRRQQLRLAHEKSLAQLQGLTDDTAVEAYASAVLPRNTLGSNQLLLVLLVFSATFVLVFLLLAATRRVETVISPRPESAPR